MAEDQEQEENTRATNRRKVRIGKLTTIGLVSCEIARIYKAARRGDMPVADASRLANVLGILRQCLEVGLVEQRLEALEKAADEPAPTPLRRVA